MHISFFSRRIPGQIDGLSVLDIGDITFGIPARITCSVSLGKGGVIAIEREAEMSGPIHTKGVMILTGGIMKQFFSQKKLKRHQYPLHQDNVCKYTAFCCEWSVAFLYWNLKGRSNGYAINFSEKFSAPNISSQFYLEQFQFLRGIPMNSVIDLNNGNMKEVKYTIKRIIIEVSKRDAFSMDIIGFNLISLFVSITRNNNLSNPNATILYNLYVQIVCK